MTRRPVSGGPAIEVRGFRPSDEPRVLDLLHAAFGQWPGGIQSVPPADFFRWKHMAGPLGHSRLIVAEADGELIGCHAYMPWRLGAGRSVVSTMRGVDLAVHPSHRRLGVSTAMRAAASFPSDISFMWSNPNKQNRPGAHNAGMRAVQKLPLYVRPHGALRRAVSRGRAKRPRAPEMLPIEAQTAAELLRDGGHTSHLLAAITAPRERMATVKDLEYLRWRYGHLQEYRAIATEPAAGTGGVAIFRTRRHGHFRVADVCELLAERDDRRTVRQLLRLVAEAAAADLITASFLSRGHAAKFGFAQRRGETVLMALPLQQNLALDPTRRESWALSRGDVELL